MDETVATLRFAPELRFFLAPRHRGGQVDVTCDGLSTLGHVIEALGVPLPEVGRLTVGAERSVAAYRLAPGDLVNVYPVDRPQPLDEPRFVLDVHLGKLARWLRLLGVDTAYSNDRDDDALIGQANTERRVLLTQDRGLLRRRALWSGAYVRGTGSKAQLDDVLTRFAPPLSPWTRCVTCNGTLAPVPKHQVEQILPPGTRRTYREFVRCKTCGQVYWHGAHAERLAALVDHAFRIIQAS